MHLPDDLDFRRDVNPNHLYELISLLGEGSYGAVYRARARDNGSDHHIGYTMKEVAIKIIPDADDDLSTLAREIRFLQVLRSPFVVSFVESLLFDNELWLVMELCDGGSLYDLKEAKKDGFNETQLKAIMAFRRLRYLGTIDRYNHEKKDCNWFTVLDGTRYFFIFTVMIGPLMIAYCASRRGTTIALTEVIQESSYDGKADIWSLGITLLELCEGHPPHFNVHPMRAIFIISSRAAPTLKEPERWSSQLQDFVSKCLVKDCDNRASASELLHHPWIKKTVQQIGPKGNGLPILRELAETYWQEIERIRFSKFKIPERIDPVMMEGKAIGDEAMGATAALEDKGMKNGGSFDLNDSDNMATVPSTLLSSAIRKEQQDQMERERESSRANTPIRMKVSGNKKQVDETFLDQTKGRSNDDDGLKTYEDGNVLTINNNSLNLLGALGLPATRQQVRNLSLRLTSGIGNLSESISRQRSDSTNNPNPNLPAKFPMKDLDHLNGDGEGGYDLTIRRGVIASMSELRMDEVPRVASSDRSDNPINRPGRGKARPRTHDEDVVHPVDQPLDEYSDSTLVRNDGMNLTFARIELNKSSSNSHRKSDKDAEELEGSGSADHYGRRNNSGKREIQAALKYFRDEPQSREHVKPPSDRQIVDAAHPPPVPNDSRIAMHPAKSRKNTPLPNPPISSEPYEKVGKSNAVAQGRNEKRTFLTSPPDYDDDNESTGIESESLRNQSHGYPYGDGTLVRSATKEQHHNVRDNMFETKQGYDDSTMVRSNLPRHNPQSSESASTASESKQSNREYETATLVRGNKMKGTAASRTQQQLHSTSKDDDSQENSKHPASHHPSAADSHKNSHGIGKNQKAVLSNDYVVVHEDPTVGRNGSERTQLDSAPTAFTKKNPNEPEIVPDFTIESEIVETKKKKQQMVIKQEILRQISALKKQYQGDLEELTQAYEARRKVLKEALLMYQDIMSHSEQRISSLSDDS